MENGDRSPWSRPSQELSLYEYALLNDGRKLAVRAALASLLQRKRIERTLNGFRTINPKRPGDPLEREIVNAAKQDPRVDILIFWMCRGEAMKSLVQTLRADGYLRGAGHGPFHPLSGPTPAGEAALKRRRAAGKNDPAIDPVAAIALFGTDQLCRANPDLALQLGISIGGGPAPDAWGGAEFNS
jgi:hypothetical protein